MADVYLLKPFDDSSEKIYYCYSVDLGPKLYITTSILVTKSGLKLPLPENHNYNFFDSTASLIIERGIIFRKPVRVRIIFNKEEYVLPVNELNRTIGGEVLPGGIFVLFLIVAFQIYLKRKINTAALLLACIFTFYLLLDAVFNLSSMLIS